MAETPIFLSTVPWYESVGEARRALRDVMPQPKSSGASRCAAPAIAAAIAAESRRHVLQAHIPLNLALRDGPRYTDQFQRQDGCCCDHLRHSRLLAGNLRKCG